ncbi:MAG TPA: undecaprenyl-phosphate glucose phosphotransferase [Caldilineaceae bacterium]|nr:undecaprenyl-phosphate glucose phosphotransferase [Caldilineaceae bacterium]
MQQSLTDSTVYQEYSTGRARRHMLMKRPQFIFVFTLILLDVATVWLSYYGAYLLIRRGLEYPDLEIAPFWDEIWLLPAIASGILVMSFFTQRMYQRRRPISHFDEYYKIVVFSSFTTLLTIAVLELSVRTEYHRWLFAYATILCIAIAMVLRTVHAQFQWLAQAHGVGDDRVLIIGAGEIGEMIYRKIIQNPKLGYQIVGFIEHESRRKDVHSDEVPILGSTLDIPRIIDKFDIDEVIIGLPESSHQDLVNIISLCEREKVGIRVFPDVFQIMASEVGIGDLGGLPLLTIRDVALQGWKLTLKRGLDLVLSTFGLILLSPLLLLTAVLIKLESPGPVFYKQERMGLDARPFHIIKFRSMRQDAEVNGPGWTVEDDPRRTRLGTILRTLSIDELPQLVNVLVGDMSLVGPRPERPVYVEQFRQSIPRYMDRHREKAGLTGWAQVNGLRGDTSIAERTKYDLWYIENWSLALDIKIILRTLLQWLVNSNRNSY